ncbi:radical SAM protein [Leptospira langatensis]|uniref:Radical SAM protein n=2 Tax=Leptospira langatensis TaxID=2484983 RepID=A0A5F1ZPZ7_9LEPT|nr:radical SAM protein [Leptospira langatensis]TGL38777.1 radical SAM protein [Leptospira langatensis]
MYCAPGTAAESQVSVPASFLSPELFQRNLSLLSKKLSIQEIHLTGGEPTLHKELPELVRISNKEGIQDIAVTSNGFFRDGLIRDLKDAGLTRMNFSLDALEQTAFSRISGKNLPLDRLLNRIEEALSFGLDVKLNCTVLKTYNEDQILPLLHWTGARNISIRYLELMKMGPLQEKHSELFYSAEEIRDRLSSDFEFLSVPTPLESTARYYETKEKYRFGIIANHTEPFCEGCNRLRMDSRGRIYGCLSDFRSFPVSEDGTELEASLHAAMQTKKNVFTGSELSMKYIGG